MRTAPFQRILGGLTAAYGAYTLVRPHSLRRAAGLEPADLPTAHQRAGLGRAIGVRDIVSGASLMLAPPGPPLQVAVVARVACDLGDAVGFGLVVPRSHRAKVIAVAAGWGLVCASTFWAAGRPA